MYKVEWRYLNEEGISIYKSETFVTKKYSGMLVTALLKEREGLTSVTLSEVD